MKSAKRYVFLIVGIIAFFGAMAFLPMQNNVAEAATPFTVAINPGHGPAKTGSGAGGAGGLKESIINEQLASKVCSSLRARGVKVVLTNYMTSLSDSTPYIIKNPPATGKQYEFADPAELLPAINTPWVFEPSLNERNDLCISLHHNAGGSRGAEIFYSSTLGAGYNKNSTTVARSADMANMISRRFSEPGFHINNRGVFDRDNNSITKYSVVPSVLVEAGYIDNIAEYNEVTNGTNQQRTADRIADAVVEYKSKYKSYAPPKLNSFSTPSTPTYNPIFKLDANVSNASSVKVAVWTVKGDQDDLKWYNMRGVGSGNWELNVDAGNFGYAADDYIIHLYGQDEDGNLKFLDGKNIYLNADDKAPTSTAVKGILKSANSPVFTAIADNVTDPSGVRGVR
ncbi:MAG: N-acetylmuramoyl-L-alanine amidase, partial [Christensenella sp.]